VTEDEWLKCSDPRPMLQFLKSHSASNRKLRLFASHCCRRVWNLHKREPGFAHRAVSASDGAADGLVDGKELKAIEQSIGALGSYSAEARASDVARTAVYQIPADAAEGASICAASYFALTAMEMVGEEAARRKAFAVAEQLEHIIQAALLRELFGNPFRPVTVNRSWLTSEVIELARKASDQPQSHQTLLAEALTTAGCDNAVMLAHCNQFGGHVKGCWPVDLLLGKI
jgi:hypothetical protein